MIKGAFGAGFTKGFGETLAEGMATRRSQREKYVDLAIDNAKRVAPAYAQSEAEISTMEDMMDQMNDDFGVSPEEFIGLAQNYDIHDIYKNVYTAKSVMEKNGIVGQIDKSMILGSLALPANFKLPEGVTPEKALRQIFQGITVYTDPRNKSEQHRAGAFGKAVSDIMSLNPRASAEEIVKGMKVAGVPVETLLGFEAGANSGFSFIIPKKSSIISLASLSLFPLIKSVIIDADAIDIAHPLPSKDISSTFL